MRLILIGSLLILVVTGLPMKIDNSDPKAVYDSEQKQTVWWNPFSLSGKNEEITDDKSVDADVEADVPDKLPEISDKEAGNLKTEPVFSFPVSGAEEIPKNSNPFLNRAAPTQVEEKMPWEFESYEDDEDKPLKESKEMEQPKGQPDTISSFPTAPDGEQWITTRVAPNEINVEVVPPQASVPADTAESEYMDDEDPRNLDLKIDEDSIPVIKNSYEEEDVVQDDSLDFTDEAATDQATNFDALSSYFPESNAGNFQVQQLISRLSSSAPTQGQSGGLQLPGHQGPNPYAQAQPDGAQGGLDPRLASVLSARGYQNQEAPVAQPSQEFDPRLTSVLSAKGYPSAGQQNSPQSTGLDPRLSSVLSARGYPSAGQQNPPQSTGLDPRLASVLSGRGYPPQGAGAPPQGGLDPRLAALANQVAQLRQVSTPAAHPRDYGQYHDYGNGAEDYNDYGPQQGGGQRVKIVAVPVPVLVQPGGRGGNGGFSEQERRQEAYQQQNQEIERIREEEERKYEAQVAQIRQQQQIIAHHQAVAQQQAIAQQSAIAHQQAIAQQQAAIAQQRQQALARQQAQREVPDYPDYDTGDEPDYDLVTVRVPKNRGRGQIVRPRPEAQYPQPRFSPDYEDSRYTQPQRGTRQEVFPVFHPVHAPPPQRQPQPQRQRFVLVPVGGDS